LEKLHTLCGGSIIHTFPCSSAAHSGTRVQGYHFRRGSLYKYFTRCVASGGNFVRKVNFTLFIRHETTAQVFKKNKKCKRDYGTKHALYI